MAPVREYLAAEQVVHEEEPELSLYFPLSQATHADVSALEWVPAPQVSHCQEADRLKQFKHSPSSEGQLTPHVKQPCRQCPLPSSGDENFRGALGRR